MHKKLNDSDQENELKEVFRVFGKDETGEAEILVIFLQEYISRGGWIYKRSKRLFLKQEPRPDWASLVISQKQGVLSSIHVFTRQFYWSV